MSQTITAIELIRRSMLLINVISGSETPKSTESNDALLTLNEMIDSWNLQSLATYGSATENWVLTPGKSSYDWGTTADGTAGNFTSERPVFVQDVKCTRSGVTTDVILISQEEYNGIGLKSLSQSLIEKVVYINSFPLGQLICFPVPTEAVTLNIMTGRLIQAPLTLASTIMLPPGYLRALRYGLAVELWPEYVNQSTDINSIKEIARNALGKVKVANSDTPVMTFENIPDVDMSRSWDWRLQ